MGGSPLNRLSWLRSSPPFLNNIVVSPATRWVVFRSGQPLVTRSNGVTRMAALTTPDVRPYLGPEPFFGQGEKEGEAAADGVPALEAARFRGAPVVFLGLDESNVTTSSALPSSDFSKGDPEAAARKVQGTPYFSLDVSHLDQKDADSLLEKPQTDGGRAYYAEARGAIRGMGMLDASLFALGRSMVDWNARNKFCAGCGSSVYSLWAGWKLSCSTLRPWADKTGKEPCITAKGIHNFSHPRTDPVVIMLVVNESGDKILLGHNKNFPPTFYSALAGFIEPGESFEDAVKRELWEEAGIKVWGVKYHSGQPWPYPSNLMVGYYALSDPSKPIRTDLDNELEDARWFTREEILSVLEHPEGTNFTGREFVDAPNTEAAEKARRNAPPFRVPPPTAIAGVLIHNWAYGKNPESVAAPLNGRL
ncbi:hypothetical protein EVG20_g1372 [Dentipellis fragilis]|uniref:NAD(+) diphosphatase n=1 Tax=Dentipellis fragilis TaxID=205917 RepID=A0A4Y9ZCQ5_9AGAM|nr:hypothetical protein EVG20_g1372 [Dentipellis fragilis]